MTPLPARHTSMDSTFNGAIFVLEPGLLVIGLSIYRKLYLVQGATLWELQDEGRPWLFANTVDFD